VHILLLTVTLAMPVGSVPSCDAAEGGWRPLHDGSRVLVELGAATGPSAARRTDLRRTFRVEDERAYAIDTIEFNCTDRTYRYLDIVIYDRDGDVMHRYHLSDQPAPVPSASYLADALRMICR
jgi:hypothetical protein